MAEQVNRNAGATGAGQGAPRPDAIRLFDALDTFSGAVEEAAGQSFDFASVTALTTDFLESADRYLIVNLKDFDPATPDNLLFLTEDRAFLYTKKHLPADVFRPFEKLLSRRFGPSTVLVLVALRRMLQSYKNQLETFIGATMQLETTFDFGKYHDALVLFERFNDRVEEFHEVLLTLQERQYQEVETRYISFDYRLLIAQSLSLQARCRRHVSVLRDVERDNETRTAMELNRRIEKLDDVVKRLTALTVIFMLPTLIASHFGMNFVFMPELKVWWAYPVVLGSQVVLIGTGVVVFRKIGWL